MGGRTGGINSRESEARDRTERHALSTWTSCISTGIESGRNHPSTGGARALGAFGRGSLEKYASFVHEGDQLREGVTIEQHIQGGGKDLRWLVERCSNRFHAISSNSCLESQNSKTQITELLEKIEKMVAGNRCEAFSPLVHEIQELGRQKK